MDPDSSEIKTKTTHNGQHKVNRLMFAVTVGPGIWQQVMDYIIQGLEGGQ